MTHTRGDCIRAVKAVKDEVPQSTLATPWNVASQAPLSMGFSRQDYWSGLPFPSSGDLPDPGIKTGFFHIVSRRFYCVSHHGSQKQRRK